MKIPKRFHAQQNSDNYQKFSWEKVIKTIINKFVNNFCHLKATKFWENDIMYFLLLCIVIAPKAKWYDKKSEYSLAEVWIILNILHCSLWAWNKLLVGEMSIHGHVSKTNTKEELLIFTLIRIIVFVLTFHH